MKTNTSIDYLGLKLRNPLVVSSSGLTSSIDRIVKLAKLGAGAVVLKSLFEEQIKYEAGSMISQSDYPEAEDYILNYTRSNTIDEYLSLIEGTKRATDIPIIASINCVSSDEWVSFAKSIEEAGADALELNVFYLPTDINESAESLESIYLELLSKIIKTVSIPVSIKLGYYFTNLPALVNKLYAAGAKGVVLFNRFYAPDVDIHEMDFTSSEVFSSPAEIRTSLRWTGIVSSLVPDVDLCSSTGVHDAEGLVKQLLVGAQAVQLCSVLYKKGIEEIPTILKGLTEWMDKYNFEDIASFRGRLSYKNIKDPAVFERAQFMKYFSNMQ